MNSIKTYFLLVFSLPLAVLAQAFEENKGQLRDDQGKPLEKVLYSMEQPGMKVYITEWGLSYIFYKKTASQVERESYVYDWYREDVILEDAEIRVDRIEKSQPVAGHNNYFYPHCPQGITQVKTYQDLLIKDVYPGIDWHFTLFQSFETLKKFKHEFIIHPGADPSLIKMQYEGAAVLEMSDDRKSLSLKTPIGELREGELYCYQKKDDKRYTINATYLLKETNIKFQLSNIVADEVLVIDPPLIWSTFFGDDGYDGPQRIRTDNTGNVYLTGYTSSEDFPLADPGNGAYYQGTKAASGASKDAFVSKFDNAGVLLWSTFLGGSSMDEGRDVCVDNTGNIYVTGEASSSDFPLLNPGGGAYFDNGNVMHGDAFVTKFDVNGALVWSTFLGGSKGGEAGNGIEVDPSGNIYVCGKTSSSNFPYVDPADGRFMKTYSASNDAFLTKFTSTFVMEWSTYLGGVRSDEAHAIDIDNAGNVFVVGQTNSNSQFPDEDPGAPAFYQGANAGPTDSRDAFIHRFDVSGVMTWGTFYGGQDLDMAFDVAVTSTGIVYVNGATDSKNFPTHDPGGVWFQAANQGNYDAFLLKFTNTGEQLWATYVGGSENDQSAGLGVSSANRTAVCVDNVGNVFITGGTGSDDYPTFDPGGGAYYQTAPLLFDKDVYITQFDANDQLVWSTCFGGNGEDWARGITADPFSCLLLTGEFVSDDPVTLDPGGGAFIQSTRGGGDDGFVIKFCPITPNMNAITSSTDVSCNGTSTGTVVVTPSSGSGTYTYDWQPGGYTDSLVSNLPAGTYTVTVDDGNTTLVDSVTINEPSPVAIDPIPDQYICTGDQVELIAIASGGTPGYTYSWDSGVETDSNYVIAPTDTTVYGIMVMDKNGCIVNDLVKVFVVPNIKAELTKDTLICLGDSVELFASGGATFQWSTGDSSSSITVSPATDSTYSVVVTSGTCQADTAQVTVSVGAPPNITITGDTTLCPGATSTLTAAGGSDYQWSTGETSAAITISPTQDTSYSVIVSNGGCWQTKNIAVQILSLPTVSINGTTILCAGDTTTLTASGGVSYQWSSGDNTPAISVTPTQDTTYFVTVTDAEGCENSDSISLNITAPPTVDAGPDQTICTGDNITLNATADGTSYSWNTGDTTLSVNVNPSVTTTYTITVNKGTCTPVTDEVTVTVSSSLAVDAGKDTTICRGGVANLYATSGSAFQWNTGATSQSITVFPATTTTYTVIASSSSGSCPNDTDEVTVTVNEVIADAGDGQMINAGQSVTLNGSGGGSYAWSPGLSLSDTTLANPTANPTITTTYTLTITDGNGCTATDLVTIIVGEPCGELFVPNAFSPNGDGINDVLYVRGCVKTMTLVIYNRWGQEVFWTNNVSEGWNGRFKDEILNPAVFTYYLQATLESGEEIVQKGDVALIR